MADTSNLSQFLTDIADAIRTKRETTEQIPAEQFDTEILQIETGSDTSDATATVNDILAPKTAYINGGKVTGGIETTYQSAGITVANDISNTNSLNIFDIDTYRGVALTGTRNATSFTLHRVADNTITDVVATFSIPDIDSTYAYKLSDLKFNYDNIENVISFFGVGVYYYTVDRQPCWQEVVFKITYNLLDNTYTTLSQRYSDNGANDQTYGAQIYFQLFVISKDLFMLKPEKYNRHNYYTHLSSVRTRRIIQVTDIFTTLSSLDMGNNTWALDATTAQVTNHLYLDYNDSKYKLYYLDNSYQFSLLKDGTDNATRRMALVDDTHYLCGQDLYDATNSLVKSYTSISASTYKICVGDYLYEFDISGLSINVYKLSESFDLEFVQQVTNVVRTYSITSVYINEKPERGYNCINYGDNLTKTKAYSDFMGVTEVVETLTIQGRVFMNTSSTNVESKDVLQDKIAYGNGEKIIGTMPDNTGLVITPGDSDVAIPEGYVKDGKVVAVDITQLSEYQTALNNTKILVGLPEEYELFSVSGNSFSAYNQTGGVSTNADGDLLYKRTNTSNYNSARAYVSGLTIGKQYRLRFDISPIPTSNFAVDLTKVEGTNVTYLSTNYKETFVYQNGARYCDENGRMYVTFVPVEQTISVEFISHGDTNTTFTISDIIIEGGV